MQPQPGYDASGAFGGASQQHGHHNAPGMQHGLPHGMQQMPLDMQQQQEQQRSMMQAQHASQQQPSGMQQQQTSAMHLQQQRQHQQQQQAQQQHQQQQHAQMAQLQQQQQQQGLQSGMHNTAGTFFMPVVHNHPQQQAQSQPQPQQQSQQQQQANAGMIPRRNTYAPGVMASGAGMELYHPPTDEEIDAILQTYGRPGAQRDVNGSQAGASGGHLDPAAAAAAAAAYGHLGYDGERSQGGAGPVDMRLQRLGGNRGPGGYEGDFSNTPSSQTPGGTSSDDSPGGKRRRMTFTAGAHPLPSVTAGQVLQQHEQQGSSMAPQHVRPSMPHSATNMIDAAAAAEYGGWAPNLHRRTLSGSLHVPPSRSSESLMDGYQPMHAPSDNMSGPQRPGHQQQQSWAGPQRNSSSGNMPGSSGGPLPLGHAASHPPGLGSQVLRGPDRASLGHNAASDFTKRKGWSNRIVEELLDFVHVLDAQGRVLFASPSVYALTGWKPEELTGKPLFEFIHSDDVADVQRGFSRSLVEHSDLLMYYRFRRKPQTAADKRQKRADIADAKAAARSPSDSTSDSAGGETSSNATNGQSGAGPNGQLRTRDGTSPSRDEDDTEDHFEVFEATGHAYFSTGVNMPKQGSMLSEDDTHKLLDAAQQSKSSNDDELSADSAQCFFCTCRVYPTKNVTMLDSFLELKLENERLRKLLAEMDLRDGPDGRSGGGARDGHDEEDPAGAQRTSLDEPAYHTDFYKAELDASYRRESAVSALGHGNFGEESQPTSPLQSSSLALERTLTAEAESDEGEDDDAGTVGAGGTEDGKRKKKKPKPDEGDYVCTDCGRVDSPEWRKGPLGPKTLCNACGLRWAKKVKRSGGDPNAISNAAAKQPSKKAQALAARAAAHAGRHLMGAPPGMPDGGPGMAYPPGVMQAAPQMYAPHQQPPPPPHGLPPPPQQQHQQQQPPHGMGQGMGPGMGGYQ